MEATQRTSLSKKQISTAAGLELLNICQSITSDGRIADEEIRALDHWLSQQLDSDLPAVRFLSATLTRILEDGVITDAERISITEAIESVLPPADRKYAKGIRRQVEREDKYDSKIAATKSKQAARRKKELEGPIAFMDFMVAGTRHDERELTISHEIADGSTVFLRRDPGNRHSRFAIKVVTDRGNMIGFVPDEDAEDIAPLLDSGANHTAYVKRVLDYDRGPVPVVVAKIYDPSVLPLPSLNRALQEPPKPRSRLLWLALIPITIVLIVVFSN